MNYRVPMLVMLCIVSLLFLAISGIAEEVDYTDSDFQALTMIGQSEQPQAGDQAVRVFRQVLNFDQVYYGGTYNEEMLDCSLMAGSVVYTLELEKASDEFRSSVVELGGQALEWGGYGKDDDGLVLLRSSHNQLAAAVDRVQWAREQAKCCFFYCLVGNRYNLASTGFGAVGAIFAEGWKHSSRWFVRGLGKALAWPSFLFGEAGICAALAATCYHYALKYGQLFDFCNDYYSGRL